MEIVRFVSHEEIVTNADALFEKEKMHFEVQLPFAEIEHVGGTAVSGLITKGDLDINIRVLPADFERAKEILSRQYKTNQAHNWNANFASFKNDSRNIGIQLTVKDSPDDCFVRQRDFLRSHPEKIAVLNELKTSFEEKDMEEYRAAKNRFFETLGN